MIHYKYAALALVSVFTFRPALVLGSIGNGREEVGDSSTVSSSRLLASEQLSVEESRANYVFTTNLPGGVFKPKVVENYSELPKNHVFAPGDYAIPVTLSEADKPRFGNKTDIILPVLLDTKGRWTKRADNYYIRLVQSESLQDIGFLQMRIISSPDLPLVPREKSVKSKRSGTTTLYANEQQPFPDKLPNIKGAPVPLFKGTVKVRKEALDLQIQSARLVQLSGTATITAIAPGVMWNFVEIGGGVAAGVPPVAIAAIGAAVILTVAIVWWNSWATSPDMLTPDRVREKNRERVDGDAIPNVEEPDRKKSLCRRFGMLSKILLTKTLCIGVSKNNSENRSQLYEVFVASKLNLVPEKLSPLSEKYVTVYGVDPSVLSGAGPIPRLDGTMRKRPLIEFDGYQLITKVLVDAKCYARYGMLENDNNLVRLNTSLLDQLNFAIKANKVSRRRQVNEVRWVLPSKEIRNKIYNYFWNNSKFNTAQKELKKAGIKLTFAVVDPSKINYFSEASKNEAVKSCY